jgi:hypothetical protein
MEIKLQFARKNRRYQMKFISKCIGILIGCSLAIQIKTEPATSQTNNLSWTTIFNQELGPGESEEDRTAGTRGGICIVAPAKGKIWHQKPVFVWQGELAKIEVQPRHRRDTVVWRKEVTANDSHVVYDGEPLQPGNAYNLVVFLGENPALEVPFQILPYATRAQHWGKIHEMETNLKQQGATDREIALHRAQYFQQQGWQSDVIQEAFSVANPSDQLQKIRQLWQAEYCSQES